MQHDKEPSPQTNPNTPVEKKNTVTNTQTILLHTCFGISYPGVWAHRGRCCSRIGEGLLSRHFVIWAKTLESLWPIGQGHDTLSRNIKISATETLCQKSLGLGGVRFQDGCGKIISAQLGTICALLWCELKILIIPSSCLHSCWQVGGLRGVHCYMHENVFSFSQILQFFLG